MDKGASRYPHLHWLIGEWKGYGQFTDRVTYIHKRFAYELAGMSLVERTMDVFPPAEASTEFELHQDVVHYYRNGDALEAIGFYVEGYVNLFSVSVEMDPLRMVAETYAVKGAPEGMRARITYEQTGENRLRGEFQLAMPEKELETIEILKLERES